jgi:hypothetical protein
MRSTIRNLTLMAAVGLGAFLALGTSQAHAQYPGVYSPYGMQAPVYPSPYYGGYAAPGGYGYGYGNGYGYGGYYGRRGIWGNRLPWGPLRYGRPITIVPPSI